MSSISVLSQNSIPTYNTSKNNYVGTGSAKPLSHEEIKALIQKELPELSAETISENLHISKPLDMFNRKVHLSVNKNINRVVITIVDRESNEVIKEFPCEELQNLAAYLKDAVGLLFDETV